MVGSSSLKRNIPRLAYGLDATQYAPPDELLAACRSW